MTLKIKKNWTFKLIANKFINILIIAAILAAVLNVFFFEKQDKKQIKENLGITSGEVIKVLRGGYRGGVLTADFTYSIDSVFYESSRSVSGRWVLGHRFPVVYSKKNSSINRMLIEVDEFEGFNLAFPDSLQQ